MKKNQYKVVSIVVSWNCKKFIHKCIDSLLKSKYPTEIVVVDNDSADGSESYIRNKYPSITVIQSGGNLGFAGGNNIAIRKAIKDNADFIFLLNPDAYIAPDTIDNLIQAMEDDPKSGMACPKIYYASEPNKIWFAGGGINWKTGTTPHIGANEIDKGQYSTIESMDRVCGCAVMIKVESLKKVGIFDESYFLYFEETDLSVKFTKNGYKLLFVPKAICWHEASSSTGGDLGKIYQYYMTRNNLVFMHKYGKQHFNLFLFYFFRRSISNILMIIKRRPKDTFLIAWCIMKGINDYYGNRLGKANLIFFGRQ